MDVVSDGPVMEQAILLFEREDLCMLLWALEEHCERLGAIASDDELRDAHDLAYELHQRIQMAFRVMNHNFNSRRD
jgi:hypothetical protein